MSSDLRMEFERVAQSLLTANLHLVGKNCAQSQMDALHAQICKLRENIRGAKATLLAKQAEIQAKTDLCLRALDIIEQAPPTVRKATNSNASSNPAPVSSSSLSVTLIELVTDEEYATIPKYMKGRLTMERINAAVDFINFTLRERYALLRQNPTKMTLEQRQRYYELKECDCEETSGKCYVTELDLKNMMASGRIATSSTTNTFKLDPTGRSILAILRHLGRIKEVRTTGIIRYVLN